MGIAVADGDCAAIGAVGDPVGPHAAWVVDRADEREVRQVPYADAGLAAVVVNGAGSDGLAIRAERDTVSTLAGRIVQRGNQHAGRDIPQIDAAVAVSDRE